LKKEKNQAYVVWRGRKEGVFTSWQECKNLIHGFPGAKFKGFKTVLEAQSAFGEGYEKYYGNVFDVRAEEALKIIGEPAYPSICVDAAWNTDTLVMEYRGVDTITQEELFRQGPFAEGTNNVGEFLAIVHGLAFLKKEGRNIPIYSDSRNAINWVRDKTHRSKLIETENNKKLFELLNRAVKWLKENEYDIPVVKWETRAWGENPADFGRK
jgi:ribonuclease HI